MEFIPLFYKNKITIINSFGDVAVTTMWSPTKTIHAKLANAGIDLGAETSRIACIGTLYGNGFPGMIRNLLYNPQIRHIILIGKDLSESAAMVVNFFGGWVTEVDHLGAQMQRITGTSKVIDLGVKSEDLAHINVIDLSDISQNGFKTAVTSVFAGLKKHSDTKERVKVDIEDVVVDRYPSEPRSHVICEKTPLMAWKEIVHKLVRFGHRCTLIKGARIELQNLKVVVDPVYDTKEDLDQHGFDLDKIFEYQKSFISPERLVDQTYSYGNRLRAYYKDSGGVPIDWLEVAAQKINKDNEARNVYISLWDSEKESAADSGGHPCLVSLYFRKFDGLLTLSAVFRTHNALDGWLRNLYGLIRVQEHVCETTRMKAGPITVVSHSISIDPNDGGLQHAKAVANGRVHGAIENGRETLRIDQKGNFVCSTDDETGEIVAQHFYDGQMLKEYRSKRADTLCKMILDDDAVSDLSHAMYLGREFMLKENAVGKAL